jgi:NADPH-dependent 2,4-dienoyl-CoA reductase/sulfur reductase-like enzyme
MHNIVILGGNFSGVSTAHYLLRHVLPSLNSTASESPAFKVTLVSPSDRTFFKIGAPRVLASTKISVDKPFASIPDAFSHYEASEFSFNQGEAVAVDEAATTVSIRSTATSHLDLLQYDSLVIATGMTSPSPLWSLHGDYKLTLGAFEDMHKRLPKAETILIAGGGPTGIETAGEIAYFHKPKNITLLSGGTRLLPRLKNTAVGKAAEGQLTSLKVKTVHNLKVTSSTKLEDGRFLVKLSDNSTKTVDIYLDATSGTPNTNFLPASWLDDAASYSKASVLDATLPVPAVCYSIWSDIQAVAIGVGDLKKSPVRSAILKEKKYKQFESDMQFVPVGPKGGAGVMFGVKVASIVVWLLKSRTFFMEKAPGLATGADFLKP